MQQKKLLLFFLIVSFSLTCFSQKKVLFFQTDWGFEGDLVSFLQKVKASGYDGIEVWAPRELEQQKKVMQLLDSYGLQVIFLCGSNSNLPFQESLETYLSYLKSTLELKPLAINSHTGSDFYTFEQNAAFLKEAQMLSQLYNIPVYHETHRGRFSYSLPETLLFIENDEVENLTLDVSHWMVVHESLLKNKDKLMERVIDKTGHIHARVGFEEGPQVNDPSAPEWKDALERHLSLWESVIKKVWENDKTPTITTEFGPPNYMPTEPFSRNPLSDQWEANVYIMKVLKERIKNLQKDAR